MSTQPAGQIPEEPIRRDEVTPAPTGRWSVEARVGGYRAVSELLREPPCEPLLIDAKASLRGFGPDVGGAIGALREALEHAEPKALEAAWNDSQPAIELACKGPRDPERLWAFVAAEVAPDERRLYELEVLAGLGDRILNATQLGKRGLADACQERQRAFLDHHGIECLGGLAQALEQDGVALYRQVGRALVALLDVERTSELPPPRSVPALAKCP